jgi:ribosomal protein S18 acetylase RimI-like enzyme
MGDDRVIGLRAATAADARYCFELHRDALGPYVARVWGWDDETQRAYHARGFVPERTRIITVDGRDAGTLVVERRPAEIYLGLIELAPGYQGHGIGSRLIRDLLAEAAGLGQPVVLEVLAVNERAFDLYRRLGFREIGRHGPDNIKIDLRRDPAE